MFRGEAFLRSALIGGEFPNGSTLIHGSAPVKMNTTHPHLARTMMQSQQQQDSKGALQFLLGKNFGNMSCGVWETSVTRGDGIHGLSKLTPATGPGWW
jgi:hypothetical protein